MMPFHVRRKYHYCATLVFTLLACPVAIAAGFDDNYQVRVGDFDSDGFADDLFVEAVPEIVLIHGEIITPIVIGPDIPSFVLRGEVDNTFSLVTALTSSELQAASQWSLSSVELTANDFNHDGYRDLGLANVPAAISGAANQIVFADSSTGSAPASILNVDTGFETFIDDVYQWYLDHDYYDVEITVDIDIFNYFGVADNFPSLINLFAQCELIHGNGNCAWALHDLNLVFAAEGLDCVQEFLAAGENPYTFCKYAYHVWIKSTTQQTTIVQDLSTAHPDAANVIQKSNEYEEGTATIEDIVDIFEIGIGTDIGGADVPVDDENLDSPEEQRAFDIHVVLADIWGWIFGESRSANRVPDVVYVTGRRVGWIGPFHTALEYSDPLLFGIPTEYLSAGPKNGLLRSQTDNLSEARNVTLGRVTPISFGARSLWSEMRSADGYYPDCLDYDLFPAIQNGYNSNSYVHGIIQATDGIVDISMSKFVGGGKPVPATFFAAGASCAN